MNKAAARLADLVAVLLRLLQLAVAQQTLGLPIHQMARLDHGDEAGVNGRVLELPDVLANELVVVGKL